jgi:predicted MFS family arabinose efflux permease
VERRRFRCAERIAPRTSYAPRPMEAWRALFSLPRDCWTLAIATFINRTGTMVLAFLVLFYERRFGLSADEAGNRYFLLGVISVVTSPFAGRLADRFGASPMIRFSLLGAGLALVVTPFLDDVDSATVALLLFSSLGELLRPASLLAVTTMTPPEQRRTAYALQRVAVNGGTAVGSAVGGFVADLSLDALFWIDGGTSLLAFVMLLIVPFHASNVAEPRAEGPPRKGPILPVDVLRDRRLLFGLLALLPCLHAFFQISGPLAEFVVNDLHHQAKVVGGLYFVNTFLIVCTEIPLNYRTSRWPHARATSLGALFTGVGFGMYALPGGVPMLVAATVVWTVGEMILFPSMSDYVAEIAPPAKRGAYMGWYSMTFGVAFTWGPMIGLHTLHDHGPTALWIGALAAGLMSALLLTSLWRAPRIKPRPARGRTP